MIKIGIIGPSEIALRRFLPALTKLKDIKFVGVAVANNDEWLGANDYIQKNEIAKAKVIIDKFGGKIFDSYKSILDSEEIDAIYLPLPPALHYTWAKETLVSGKHLLVEKPATTSLGDSRDLIETAKKSNLAIHENYMFTFHSQLDELDKIIMSKEIGQVRLYRISFGFPKRETNDFRYNKKLGGGALLDCGGYTLKYGSILLGESTRVVHATSNYLEGFDVDMYGSATLINTDGITAQIAFGMDNSYKCDLEVWGSNGCLKTGRVLTAPADFVPEVSLKTGNIIETRKLSEDDSFMKSIIQFQSCIINSAIRKQNYLDIIKQAELVDEFVKLVKNK